MYWSGVLALLGWAASAIAQGNVGGDQTASCPAPASNWQYAGCFGDQANGGKANFPFRLETGAGAAKSYPGYTSGTQTTVDVCNTACRGHGFQFAGTFNGNECYCSSKSPYPQSPSSGSTQYYSSSNASYYGSSPGTASADSNCNVPCVRRLHAPCLRVWVLLVILISRDRLAIVRKHAVPMDTYKYTVIQPIRQIPIQLHLESPTTSCILAAIAALTRVHNSLISRPQVRLAVKAIVVNSAMPTPFEALTTATPATTVAADPSSRVVCRLMNRAAPDTAMEPTGLRKT